MSQSANPCLADMTDIEHSSLCAFRLRLAQQDYQSWAVAREYDRLIAMLKGYDFDLEHSRIVRRTGQPVDMHDIVALVRTPGYLLDRFCTYRVSDPQAACLALKEKLAGRIRRGLY